MKLPCGQASKALKSWGKKLRASWAPTSWKPKNSSRLCRSSRRTSAVGVSDTEPEQKKPTQPRTLILVRVTNYRIDNNSGSIRIISLIRQIRIRLIMLISISWSELSDFIAIQKLQAADKFRPLQFSTIVITYIEVNHNDPGNEIARENFSLRRENDHGFIKS